MDTLGSFAWLLRSSALGPVTVVFIGLFLIRQNSPRHAWIFFWSTVCFGLLCLWGTWWSAVSDGNLWAGLLPLSDSQSYFFDAISWLNGDPISAFSARRPLLSLATAGILEATGGSFLLCLITFTTAMMATVAATTLTVRTHYGRYPALIFYTIVHLFYRRFYGQVMTEQLGLLGGLVALYYFLLTPTGLLTSRAVAALSLGLVARAGAFFVLPLSAWIVARTSWKPPLSLSRFRGTVLGVFASLLIPFLSNAYFTRSVGAPEDSGFANFSYSLYGLARGYRGWELLEKEHPEIIALAEPARSHATYAHAIEAMRAEPLTTVYGIGLALVDFGRRAFSFVRTASPFGAPRDFFLDPLLMIVLTGCGLLGIVRLVHNTAIPARSVLLASAAGMLASAPFAPPVDSDSMRVYAATIPFLALIAALPFFNPAPHPEPPTSPSIREPRPVGTIGLLACAAVVFGFLRSGTWAPPSSVSPKSVCSDRAAIQLLATTSPADLRIIFGANDSDSFQRFLSNVTFSPHHHSIAASIKPRDQISFTRSAVGGVWIRNAPPACNCASPVNPEAFATLPLVQCVD